MQFVAMLLPICKVARTLRGLLIGAPPPDTIEVCLEDSLLGISPLYDWMNSKYVMLEVFIGNFLLSNGFFLNRNCCGEFFY